MSISDLSARELARLDAVCLEYERRLRAGESVEVDELVRLHGGSQAALLRRELALVQRELSESPTATLESPTAPRATPPVPGSAEKPAVEASSSEEPSSRELLPPGTELGPYTVEALIGRGGMGEVFRGRDSRLGRSVAIKVLSDDWASRPDRRERFDREARAIAGLRHPSIVALYDVGNHQGRPFAVMELLEGVTLRQRLREGPMSAEQVRRLGYEAAEALAAAHRQGIIHRDLKPENLFITREGRVKLLDFGLSRTSDTDWPTASEPTTDGVILGTLGYMSPEQARGDQVTASADLFSLGCVLYECFFGRRAFSASRLAESLAAILHHHPQPDPVRAAVDPGLAGVIERCLRKSPQERWADAAELAAALSGVPAAGSSASLASLDEGLAGSSGRVSTNRSTLTPDALHGAPTAVTRAAAAERSGDAAAAAPQLTRRRWVQVAIAAGVVTSGGSLWWMRPRPAIRSLAVLSLDDGQGDRPDALANSAPGTLGDRAMSPGEQLAVALSNQLARLPDLEVRPFRPLRAEGPQELRRVGAMLGVDAVVVGTVREEEGAQLVSLQLVRPASGETLWGETFRYESGRGPVETGASAARLAQQIGRQLVALRSGNGAAVPEEAYQCLFDGTSRLDPDVEAGLRASMACFHRVLEIDSRLVDALAPWSLAAVYLAARVDVDERLVLIEQAREKATRALQLDGEAAVARLARGMLHWQIDWQYAEAQDDLEAALSALPNQWHAHHQQALLLSSRGQADQAIRHADRAAALHPMSVTLRLDAARIRWFAGNPQPALSESLAVLAERPGDANATGLALDVLEEQGRWATAAAVLRGQADGLLASFRAATTESPSSRQAYIAERAERLRAVPYGPFGEEVNELILRVRRGDRIDDGQFRTARRHRPPMLPWLLAVHPALTPLRPLAGARDVLAAS